MQRLFLFLLLIGILSLSALSVQDVKACSENAVKEMVQTLNERNDYSHMFVNPYPYSLMMYYQAIELHYTQMLQYAWDEDAQDWIEISEMIVEYDGEYPTTFSQSVIVQEQEVNIVYDFTTTGGVLTNMTMSMDYAGQMMEISRETYTFTGNQWTYLIAESNIVVQWINDFQINATWNGGNITELLCQSWNSDEIWEDDYRETWQYSGSNPTQYLLDYWNGVAWENEELETYTFSGDTITQELGQLWEGEWINEDRTTYTWDGDMIASHIEELWDGSQWYDSKLVTYYVVDGELGYVISQDWVEGREWVNSGKYVYNFGEAVDGEDIPQVNSSIDIYPNPFNPSTNISYSMAQDGFVTIDIYNIRGQKVETLFNGHQDAGTHTLTWNAQVAGGIYFAVMNTGNKQIVQKMVLLK